jgi:predicted AAA+ superfamily ATPase
MAGASVLIKDMNEHEGNGSISADSIDSYLNALKQIFIIDEQQAWLPSLRSKTRIRTSPKRHFVDPSLAAAAFEFDAAAKHLLALKRKMADQTEPCVFLLILTATGGAAYTRDEGVHVVPLDCLKP